MNAQPEALRLAAELEACPTINYKPHAAELRRLHADTEYMVELVKELVAQRDALLEALRDIAEFSLEQPTKSVARAAIATAEGEDA